MERECEEITHIIGLDLAPGVYEFFFLSESNLFLSEYFPQKIMETTKLNFIEITEHATKEKITKIYTKSPSLEVFIVGSWEKYYSTKYKMLPYRRKLKDFWKKEKEFIGLESLKKENHKQIDNFLKYISEKDFYSFHQSHYDWWAFPIEEGSMYGFKYSIDPVEAELLKNDEGYMKQYLNGVRLLALAWGWDILNANYVEYPKQGQCWAHWPIRLYKAVKSLNVLKRCNSKNYFDEKILIYLSSLQKYAKILIKKYGKFHYNNVNFDEIFPVD